MKIAVLAWGSLLWSPRELKIDSSPWLSDGPELPIEFSRIASDGRLTLVIDPKFDDVPTFWHLMEADNLEEARKNLQSREGADTIEEIGFVAGNNYQIRKDIEFLKSKIKAWLDTKNLDAVIWTDLTPKFYEKTGVEFSLENALDYLSSLSGQTLERAREYIIKTPPQTRTKYRLELEKEVSK